MNTFIRQTSSKTDRNTDYIQWVKNMHIYNKHACVLMYEVIQSAMRCVEQQMTVAIQ